MIMICLNCGLHSFLMLVESDMFRMHPLISLQPMFTVRIGRSTDRMWCCSVCFGFTGLDFNLANVHSTLTCHHSSLPYFSLIHLSWLSNWQREMGMNIIWHALERTKDAATE